MDVVLILIVGIIVALVIGGALRKARPSGMRSPEDPTPDPPDSRHGTEAADQPDIPAYPGESRPAGPGAEAMTAPEPGSPTPGDPQQDGEEPDAVPPSEAGRKNLDDEA